MTARIHKGGPSNAEKIARREVAMERILVLLAEKPLSVTDIAQDLKISQNTAYGYLRYMVELGDVHRTDETEENGRALWALGRDEGNLAEVPKHPGFKGVVNVPARQVGIPRDPLVAALFGPAREAA